MPAEFPKGDKACQRGDKRAGAPIFTPTKSSRQFSVKRESRIAEGTLLIIWQERVEMRSVFFSIKPDKNRFTASMRDILPEKIKKQKKVKSS